MKIKTGRQVKPMIHTIYGLPGVGKTTWAASFPTPLILDLEKGSHHLDVARLDEIETYDQVTEILGGVLFGHEDYKPYKTLVIDSIEAIESLMADKLCKEEEVDSIEKVGGGYGKGYQRLRELAREMMVTIGQIRDKRGVEVILIGHSQTKDFSDPSENTTFTRYVMRVNDKMGSIIRDLSDNVFFACHKVTTFNDKGKTKAFSDGQRIIRTEWRAAFDAKNRMNLPFEIPLSYQAFMEALESAKPRSAEEIKGEIKDMMKGLDPETKPKAEQALEKATTVGELLAIKQRIQTLVAA